MAKNVLEELLMSLGVEVDKNASSELNKFTGMAEKAAKNLLKIAGAATAAATATVYFVKKVSESTDALGKSAEKIGIGVSQLDALGFAAELATGRSDGLISSMERLARISSEAAIGKGGGIEAFGRLGIDPVGAEGIKSADQLLFDIADKIKLIDNSATRLELAEKLGLGGLDLLLKQGSSGIKELIERGKDLAIVTEEDAEKAALFNDALSKSFNRIVKGASVLISSELSPALTELADGFSDWFIANKELIKSELEEFLKTVVSLLRMFFSIVKGGVKFIYMLITAVGGMNNAFRIFLGLVGLFAAFNFVSMIMGIVGALKLLIGAINLVGISALIAQAEIFAWLFGILAAIAIIVLAIDDMITFSQGGESFFDELLKKFPAIEKALMPLADTIVSILEMLDSFTNILRSPLSTDAWKKFFDKILSLLKTYTAAMRDTIINILPLNLGEKLKSISTGLLDNDLDKPVDFKKVRPKKSEGTLDKIIKSIPKGIFLNPFLSKINPFASINKSSINSNKSSAAGGNNNSLQIGSLTIPISTELKNTDEIKKAVMDGIQEASGIAMGNLQSGVIA